MFSAMARRLRSCGMSPPANLRGCPVDGPPPGHSVLASDAPIAPGALDPRRIDSVLQACTADGGGEAGFTNLVRPERSRRSVIGRWYQTPFDFGLRPTLRTNGVFLG